MEYSEAERIVVAELRAMEKRANEFGSALPNYTNPEMDLTILDELTIERPFGWVFFYADLRYVETGEFRNMLGGNAPFIIDRASGEIVPTGTSHHIDHYVVYYEQHGTMVGCV